MESQGKQRIAAVVVTWNSARDITACLDSLINQTREIDDIIVVDNASSDGTPDAIASRYPTVKLERRLENEGFACANNIGIKNTFSDWVLTLNPDAWLAHNWLEVLLSFVEGKDRIGMLGGKLLTGGTSSSAPVIDSLGIEIFRSRRVRDRAMGVPDSEELNKVERVFGICAGAALYRRKMLDDVGIMGEVFPERFFAYYEDADLAWRAWRRGWEAWLVPEACGWHKRGGSPIVSRFSRYMTHRNRLGLIARNEPLLETLTALPELLVHETLMLARVIRYPYLIKALFEAIADFPKAIRERKRLLTTNPVPPPFQPGIGFGEKSIYQKNKPT